MKRARIGDLAIARLDPRNDDERFHGVVCFVTGSAAWQLRETCSFNFIYWEKKANRTLIHTGNLPTHRLQRVRLKSNLLGSITGFNLRKITIDDVIGVK